MPAEKQPGGKTRREKLPDYLNPKLPTGVRKVAAADTIGKRLLPAAPSRDAQGDDRPKRDMSKGNDFANTKIPKPARAQLIGELWHDYGVQNQPKPKGKPGAYAKAHGGKRKNP